jgi:adenine-specific DNA glycosylase
LVLVAAVALVDVDGRVLIAQRPEGKSMAGLWEFPGGKVDPGETPEEALVRELQRGARHRDGDELPGADRLRQPRLRDVPSADAGLRLPQMERHAAAA